LTSKKIAADQVPLLVFGPSPGEHLLRSFERGVEFDRCQASLGVGLVRASGLDRDFGRDRVRAIVRGDRHRTVMSQDLERLSPGGGEGELGRGLGPDLRRKTDAATTVGRQDENGRNGKESYRTESHRNRPL